MMEHQTYAAGISGYNKAILLSETHRLANTGAIPLEIIQVPSRSYLGEDNIVRFEYTYGKK